MTIATSMAQATHFTPQVAQKPTCSKHVGASRDANE
eukprot:CAMPEP_0177394374 /NCGR_PEP_ID=MMETSP0368-20130122/55498_1 /TAXON_ID=447022 ORGANISM="Scrippsiella hangoei-like, Strain SHHI-4" /NCGR_SAMPLE_ID=MMETSP0368 /ASSEMBLY_ACC=CAM_ASM_000363 /LENGTH=35 /DNA_ID= /DNA_START= /DNA_END= /DNA_ORIENTATION=